MTFHEEEVECASVKIVVSCDETKCDKSATIIDAKRDSCMRIMVQAGWTVQATPLGPFYRCKKCSQKWIEDRRRK